MDRVNAILGHPLYRASLDKTAAVEAKRKFCRHGMDHFLDVARIAYILCLESGDGTPKELVYAAGLLHDIGRFRQYKDGTPHEAASADIARKILPECGFDGVETDLITTAVLAHRSGGGAKPGFAGILYRADKLSRRCLDCKASAECDWETKNTRMEY